VANLTPKQERFVQEYLVDLNATQAYMRAYPGAKRDSANVMATRLMAMPAIQEAIAKAKAKRAQETGITAKCALEEVWAIATADTRELVEYVVGCCRHCWGEGYRYQRTAAEMERDVTLHAASTAGKVKAKDFDRMGGVGYNATREPNKECPECFGLGTGRTVFKDTRTVSKAAASLFAGVKETRDGLEIKLHSKDAALDKVMRHLGLYEKDNSQVGAAFAERLVKARERAGKA
jgi:phage terminase small subunit